MSIEAVKIPSECGMLEHVHTEGPVETSVGRPSGRDVTVDRKAALMVYKLKKYKVSVAGISETNWFGQAVYEVEVHDTSLWSPSP